MLIKLYLWHLLIPDFLFSTSCTFNAIKCQGDSYVLMLLLQRQIICNLLSLYSLLITASAGSFGGTNKIIKFEF